MNTEIKLKESEIKQINSSKDIFNLLKQYFTEEREEVYFIGVNTKNKIKYIELIGIGDLNSSIVDTRVLFKRCFTKDLRGFFLAHNHPSGDLNPSSEDEEITRTIIKQSELLKLRFLDHIIFNNESYYSLFDNDRGGF